MAYFFKPLRGPYNYRSLIEAYVRTRRADYCHDDFPDYYQKLLAKLEELFGVRMDREALERNGRILWGLFNSTVASLNRIAGPWDGYLEAGLLVFKLDQSGEPGQIVRRASTVIDKANEESRAAHREMLHALFVIIFGEQPRVVTSRELADAGLDDTLEPKFEDYYDFM